MAELHFTLGEDLGIQLAEIAKEHIQNMRLDKAIEVFTGSFGCSEDIAKRLVTGNLVVTVEDPEKCVVNVCNRDDLPSNLQKQYPTLSSDEIYKIIEKNFQDAYDYAEDHVFEHFRLEMSNVNRLIISNNELYLDAELSSLFFDLFPEWFPKGVSISGSIAILPRTIVKDVLEHKGNASEFGQFIDDAVTYNISKYSDGYKMYKIIYLTKAMINAIKNEKQIIALEDFCQEQYGCERFHKYSTERYLESIKEILGQWLRLSSHEKSRTCAYNDSEDPQKFLEEYLKTL